MCRGLSAIASFLDISSVLLLMDHNVLDLDNVPPFIDKDWIGTGKQYPKTDTPYEHMHGRLFRDHPDATATFRTQQFMLLTSNAFLCLLSSTPKTIPTGLELAQKATIHGNVVNLHSPT
jgi:hypothetical protein